MISDITTDSFVYTLGSKRVTVEIKSYTKFFLNGSPTTSDSLLVSDVTAGTSGVVDPSSTPGNEIVDANHVYLSTLPPTTTTTPSSTTTTVPAGPVAPPNTAAGELNPGGTISDVTSTSFVYTLGSKVVTIEIEPYTRFFLNGASTTATSLTLAGVTVGTSGILDPSSTLGNEIVDANHVYLSN
jgi:hypothetical protein